MYELTDDFLTGIDAIDEEHRRLFAIFNEVAKLLQNQIVVDKYDYIIKILEELKDYTKTHFAHEEEYMDSILYRKRFTQKIQHAEFIKRLEAIDLSKLDENQQDSLQELLDFLAKWLFSHIKTHDVLIGK